PTETTFIKLPAPTEGANITETELPFDLADECIDARILYTNTPKQGSTVGASATGYLDCGGLNSNGEGVWYKFLGNGDDNTISILSSTFTVQLHVYSSPTQDCGDLECAAGVTGQGTN